jgi:RNA polymerase sigma factor (sigma-70 family)
MDADDAQLLERLATGDRSALNGLAARHLDFVYSTARRYVADPHLAEDVTQAVFVILTAKASRLGGRVVLAGWLYRTTAYVAANALKIRRRREHHERRAAGERSEHAMTPEPVDTDSTRQIEEAISMLDRKSRDAVLLRFFKKCSLAEVGRIMGVSEEAARKRVARAVDQLRGRLSPKASPSAASTTAMLAAIPQHIAPESLHLTLAQAGTASPAALALTKGVTLMMMSKPIGVAASVAMLLLVGGAATMLVLPWPSGSSFVVAAEPPAEKSQFDAEPDDGRVVARFPQATVQLIAVGPPNEREWWSPSAGRRVERFVETFNATLEAEEGKVQRLFVLDVGMADNENGPATSTIEIAGASAQGGGKVLDTTGRPVRFALANVPSGEPAQVNVNLATGPWETVARLVAGSTDEVDGARLDSLVPGEPRGTQARVRCDTTGDLRALAVSADGSTHPMWLSQFRRPTAADGAGAWNLNFRSRDIDPSAVKEIIVQRRPFNHTVEFRDIATDAALPTKPVVRLTNMSVSGKAPPP